MLHVVADGEHRQGFPRPWVHRVRIHWPGQRLESWRIRSVAGEILDEGQWTTGPLDLGLQSSGMLLLEPIDRNGERGLARLVNE